MKTKLLLVVLLLAALDVSAGTQVRIYQANGIIRDFEYEWSAVMLCAKTGDDSLESPGSGYAFMANLVGNPREVEVRYFHKEYSGGMLVLYEDADAISFGNFEDCMEYF